MPHNRVTKMLELLVKLNIVKIDLGPATRVHAETVGRMLLRRHGYSWTS